MCMGPSSASKFAPRLMRVRDAGFDPLEETVLAVARLIFQSFTVPTSQAWSRSFTVAAMGVGQEKSGALVSRVLNVVQTMRLARRDGFRFSNPDCPQCALFLSENERLLMGVILASRRRHQSALHANAMVLCEGNDASQFLAAVCDLTKFVSAGVELSERMS